MIHMVFILSRYTRAWHVSVCIKCVSSVCRIKIKSSLERGRMSGGVKERQGGSSNRDDDDDDDDVDPLTHLEVSQL